MNNHSGDGGPEFSRIVALESIGRNGVTMEIVAEAEELTALARRFAIISIGSLSATVTLEREEQKKLVHLRGRFSGDVVQSCVVTLEPVAARLEVSVEMTYTTEESAAPAVSDMAPDEDVAAEEDDGPEYLENEDIDIGEFVAELLGINLDPYPRRPGVVFSEDEVKPETDEDRISASPFAALRNLKTS